MTPEEFDTLLSRHDWHYAYSDDHRIWQHGEAERSRIQSILRDNPSLEPIYTTWLHRIFGKPLS